MNRILRILCGAACAFVFCFLAIGYAAVQDELTVTGSVSVQTGWYAVYSADAHTLYFLYGLPIAEGAPIPDTGNIATAVYTDHLEDSLEPGNGWIVEGYATEITTVVFLDNIAPYNMSNWFCGCTNLKDIIGMAEHLDTTNVWYMDYTFAGCKSLTELDLSRFNTGKVSDMQHMFDGCTKLQTIYASESFVTSGIGMNMGFGGGDNLFVGCQELAGGNGTAFRNVGVTNYTYARIDEDGKPGYFTRPGTQNINNLNNEKSESIVETITLTTHIENITWTPSGKLTANNDFGILMTANEGCIFPDTIMVEIEGVGYTVAANGEHTEGEPWFDPEENILYIPGTLLTESTKSVFVMAVAVHNPLAPAATCSCTTQCTAENTRGDCPVCGTTPENCSPVVCTCESTCTGGEANAGCPACSTDAANCSPREPEPAAQCGCTVKCAEGAVNENCTVCTADMTGCIITESQPAQTSLTGDPPTCTCETKCTAQNNACTVCAADFSTCKGKIPEPPAITSPETQPSDPTKQGAQGGTE